MEENDSPIDYLHELPWGMLMQAEKEIIEYGHIEHDKSLSDFSCIYELHCSLWEDGSLVNFLATQLVIEHEIANRVYNKCLEIRKERESK